MGEILQALQASFLDNHVGVFARQRKKVKL